MEQNSSERLARYTEHFGDKWGSLFHALESDHFWLRLKWQEARALFRSEARVDLLNRAARDFWGMMQQVLLEDILLHISRLTDPPRSAGKDNLTVQRLVDLHWANRERLTALVDEAVSASSFARPWRNRSLAHRDLELATGIAASPLPPATAEDVGASLSALDALFAGALQMEFGTQLDPEIVVGGEGAEDLLLVLRGGLVYEDQQSRLSQTGEEDPHWFDPLPD